MFLLRCRSILLSSFLVCALLASHAFATQFAVLLGDVNRDNSCNRDVPNGGTGSDLRPSSMEIIIPASAMTSPRYLNIDFDPTLPADASKLPGTPFFFSLSLTDASTGAEVTQFADPVQICFSEEALPNSLTYKKLCLGYLDESGNPPKWKCEDPTLEKKAANGGTSSGQYCGETDHFTLFTLAETTSVPEPTIAAMFAAGIGLATRRRSRVH